MDMRKIELNVATNERFQDGPSSVIKTLGLSTDISSPLMVPELFQNILDCFRPTADLVGRQTLVALAQTCSAFSDPSLDRLWKKQYSLKPLIRCYTSLDEFENGNPPTLFQFKVIDRYSHRIRELTMADPTSLRFLQCTSMRRPPLLPNLVALRWSPYVLTPHVPIIFIQPLLSPTLASLEATLAEEDELTLLSFFANYPLLCKALRSVEFRFSSEQSNRTIRALSQAICSQDALESVTIHGSVDESALTYLCKSPMIKVLSLHLPEISNEDIFRSTDSLLCNAEELEFTGSDLHLVTSLLRPHKQIFHSLKLFHRGRQTSDAVVNFLSVLTSRSSTHPLHRLTLSIGDTTQPVPADRMSSQATLYCLSYKTLQPLMVASCLRELIVEWSEQISLDDQELGQLVFSWPSLQVFNLYCGRGGYPPFSTKYPTLLGLLSLVASCPELCMVSLPLDARHIPAASEEQAHETEFACLVVPESPIDEPSPVAEFLCKYLPSVTAVDAKFMRPPGSNIEQIMAYEHAWQQVDIHLEEFYNSSLDVWESGPDSSTDSEVDVDMNADVGVIPLRVL